MRIFDPDIVVKEFRQLGFTPDEEKIWREHGRAAARHRARHRPDRFGQDDDALFDAEGAGDAGHQRLHGRRPDRNGLARVQPDAGAARRSISISPTGVRTLLRQDPDIIMIGEIRDLETAQMAVQASLTGHLVLSTLHTNDAPSALTRLLDLGVPNYLIQSTLTGIVAQRLVRTLCPHCKVEAPLDVQAWAALTHRWTSVAAGKGVRAQGLPRMPQDRLPRPHRHLRDAAHHAADPRDDPGRTSISRELIEVGVRRTACGRCARRRRRRSRAASRRFPKSSTCCRRPSSEDSGVFRSTRPPRDRARYLNRWVATGFRRRGSRRPCASARDARPRADRRASSPTGSC